MQVVVKLFATFRDRVGAKQVSLQLPDSASVGVLRERLLAEYPALAPAMAAGIFAVNKQFASLDLVLKPDDEIALFPPVSGGRQSAAGQVSAARP